MQQGRAVEQNGHARHDAGGSRWASGARAVARSLILLVTISLAMPVSAGAATIHRSPDLHDHEVAIHGVTVHGGLGADGIDQSLATFNPREPFTVVGDPHLGEFHIDTVDGQAPDPAVIEQFRVAPVELPPGVAAAQAGTTIHWRDPARPNDPSDPDIMIHAKTPVPDAVVDLVAQVFAEYRQVIDLDLAAPKFHHIELYWYNLGPNVLGGAASVWYPVQQDQITYLVPAVLANTLVPHLADAPAMRIDLSSAIAWDHRADPGSSASGYHLMSVLRHEVGHALGISPGHSDRDAVARQPLSWWGFSLYADRDVNRPLFAFRNSILAQNRMWTRNLDGTWERIYDPVVWERGSSLSHLDEFHYPGGTRGSLMTPFLAPNEVARIDGTVVGLLSRSGYLTSQRPAAPTVRLQSIGGGVGVSITPNRGGTMNVPAHQWLIEVRDPGGAVVAAGAVPATERQVNIEGLRGGEQYRVVVSAEIDGNTATAPTQTMIAGAPRLTVAQATTLNGILNAIDYTDADADVLRLYRAFFAREPDVVGVQYWLARHRQGVSYDEMSWAFAHSTEFAQTYGAVDDRQFLAIVYGNVLGRTPDQAGLDYWYGQMQAGLARHLVVRWVAAGSEFIAQYPYAPNPEAPV